MKRLMLVRHGESEWNSSRRLQGQADIALSSRGREQAKALTKVIAPLQPERIAVSSLKRAVETAALIGFPEAEKMEALREIDVGEWTGETIEDLIAADREAYRGWRAGAHTPPGGEDWSAFKRRTNAAIENLLAGEATRILVVGHGGVLRALLESLIELSPSRIVPVGPGSLTTLQRTSSNGRAEFRLELFNYTPGDLILDAPD
jgi:probable phosphoglycerate mutase